MTHANQAEHRSTTNTEPQNVRLYSPNPDLCSLVSVPQRCPLWGEASYRGNCDGTLFKELVHRYKPRSIADPMAGSGTTHDVLRGLARHGMYKGRYWSGDLKRGFDLASQPLPGTYDMVWVHPPYWNIIRYSDHPADLSTIVDFEEFIDSLGTCLRRCSEALNPRGRLAVLIGDVRRRGRYYCLAHHIMQMAPRLGELSSVIIKAQHNCSSDKKRYSSMTHVPIKHEYCLLFNAG